MSRYSQLQTSQITSALKRANQRIAQLGKTYGYNSSIYKQEAGKFEKGAYKDLVRYTTSKARGRNVQKQKEGKWEAPESHIAFDIKAITKFIRSGGNPSEIDRVLAEFAGIKVRPDGEIVEVKGGGVPTTTEVDKRITKRLERLGEDWTQMSKQEIRARGEMMYEFQENFQTTYETYIAKFGEAEARKDSTIKVLYGEFRGSKKRLTYDELYNIKEKMQSYINEAASEALTFEEENTNEL